jgi:hypothetical protein
MNLGYGRIAIIVLISIAPRLGTDTLQTSDRQSINGTVTSFENDALHFRAEIAGATEDYTVQRTNIHVLEFNSNTWNHKAPHGPFFVREPEGGRTARPGNPPVPKAPTAGGDIVYLLHGGGQKTGRVVSVNKDNVTLEGSPPIPRAQVHSIEFTAGH